MTTASRKQHAERKQRLGVDPFGIGELDEDRLGGKEDGAERRERVADPEAAGGARAGATAVEGGSAEVGELVTVIWSLEF